uniref:Uncharacterized protein n=1 Tax=Brassica campestris TaxID=3711 RepID=A0A3P5YHU0_BRACM|nr:unnamed protein product [Brassica rapa]
MEGSSKKMMKRPIEEVSGCDALKVSIRGRRKLWYITGLFFVCPTNTGYRE